MNYRLFTKEIAFKLGEILTFEGPENLSNIRIEKTRYNSEVLIVGLESYSTYNYPKKIYKLMILEKDSTIEYSCDYEPKVIDCGTFTIFNGRKFYPFLLS